MGLPFTSEGADASFQFWRYLWDLVSGCLIREWDKDPEKFSEEVLLERVCFPYVYARVEGV